MPKFEVGEMAVLIASAKDYLGFSGIPLGDEVEIMEGPCERSRTGKTTTMFYRIIDCSGRSAWAAHFLLHKKRHHRWAGARKWFDEKIKLNPKVLEEA